MLVWWSRCWSKDAVPMSRTMPAGHRSWVPYLSQSIHNLHSHTDSSLADIVSDTAPLLMQLFNCVCHKLAVVSNLNSMFKSHFWMLVQIPVNINVCFDVLCCFGVLNDNSEWCQSCELHFILGLLSPILHSSSTLTFCSIGVRYCVFKSLHTA